MEDNLCASEGKRQRIQPHIASKSPIEAYEGLQRSARLVKSEIILNHSTKLTFFLPNGEKRALLSPITIVSEIINVFL